LSNGSKRRFVMGLDGGGTKTACLVADEHLRSFGHGLGGPTNLNFVSAEVACQSVLQAATGALDTCPVRPARLAAICAVMAGADLLEPLARLIPLGEIIHAGESAPVRAANFSSSAGVVVIAGTGSMASGQNSKGERASAGGWGSTLGDEGSAYDIAMHAVIAAIRAQDGRGQPTALAQVVREHFNISSLGELVNIFYHRGVARHELSRLFPKVAMAARQGDQVARDLLRCAGKELGICAAAAIRRLNMQSEAVEVVASGGVIKAGHLIMRPLRAAVRRAAPQAKVYATRLEPVAGALLMALEHIGLENNARMRSRLIRRLRAEGLGDWPWREILKLAGVDAEAWGGKSLSQRSSPADRKPVGRPATAALDPSRRR
jgi:N-acetylglucosamine kinase